MANPLVDAKRYLWLLGTNTADDPVELLRSLVAHVERLGAVSNYQWQLSSQNIKLSARVAELETELREAKKRSAAHIDLLEAQLSADHQHRRIQDLEMKLKEAKAQTAAFRRAVVHGASENKKP